MNFPIRRVDCQKPTYDPTVPLQEQFLGLLIGRIGSGKSTVIVNFLDNMNYKFDFVFFVGRQARTENKWLEGKFPRGCIYKFDRLDDSCVASIMREIRMINSGLYDHIELPYANNNGFVSSLMGDERSTFITTKYGMKPKKKFLLIVDDQAGNDYLWRDKTLFEELVVSMRHFGLNILISTQYYKRVNPCVRANAGDLIVFKTTDKILKQVYEETDFKWDEFYEGYKTATKKMHGFLYVSLKNNKMFNKFDLSKEI